MAHDWRPLLADADLKLWARRGFTRKNSGSADQWIKVACARDRAPGTWWGDSPDEAWRGLHANVHRRGWKVYFGQYDGTGPLVLEIWQGNGEQLRQEVRTTEDSRVLANVLQYRLRNGWGEERF